MPADETAKTRGLDPPITNAERGLPPPATTPAAPPAPAQAQPAPAAEEKKDPELEGLNLAEAAKKAAYALKKKYPFLVFISGRRTKKEQAWAMARNVVENRKYIYNPQPPYGAYKYPKVVELQKWVDANPSKVSREDIASGLEVLLEKWSDIDMGRLTFHFWGRAFDLQPPKTKADDEIIKTIKSLPGYTNFVPMEAGEERWHAEY